MVNKYFEIFLELTYSPLNGQKYYFKSSFVNNVLVLEILSLSSGIDAKVALLVDLRLTFKDIFIWGLASKLSALIPFRASLDIGWGTGSAILS